MVPRDGGTGELAYQAPKASPCLSKSAFFQKIGVYFFGNEIIPVGDCQRLGCATFFFSIVTSHHLTGKRRHETNFFMGLPEDKAHVNAANGFWR